ncbi:hypothetical protein H1R20_g10761, partial [Candolleomyces eurysporus]
MPISVPNIVSLDSGSEISTYSEIALLLSKGSALTKAELGTLLLVARQEGPFSVEAFKTALPILSSTPPQTGDLHSVKTLKGNYVVCLAMHACHHVLNMSDSDARGADAAKELSQLLESNWSNITPWLQHLYWIIQDDSLPDSSRKGVMDTLRKFLFSTLTLRHLNKATFFGDDSTAFLVLHCLLLIGQSKAETLTTPHGSEKGCLGVCTFALYADDPIGRETLQQYLLHDPSPDLRFRFACAAAGLLHEMETRSNSGEWGRHTIFTHAAAILKLLRLLTFDEAGWRHVLSVEGVRLIFQILSEHVLYDDGSSKSFEMAVARVCHEAFDWIRDEPTYTNLKIEQALGKGTALWMAFSVCSMCAVRDLDSSAYESDLDFAIAHTSHLLALPGVERSIQKTKQSVLRNGPPQSRQPIPPTSILLEKWEHLDENVHRGTACLKKAIPHIPCGNLNTAREKIGFASTELSARLWVKYIEFAGGTARGHLMKPESITTP